MKTLLFNPFEKIAGMQSIVIGAVTIFLTSIIAFYANIHLDGVLDMHPVSNSELSTVTKTGISISLAEGLIDWLSMVIFVYITGLILSRSSIRFVDVLGTQGMARLPFFFCALVSLLPFDDHFIKYIEYKFLKQGEPAGITTMDMIGFGFMGLFMIAAIIWNIILMYRAYVISCNLKGARAIVSFIVCLILAEVLSKILIVNLLN